MLVSVFVSNILTPVSCSRREVYLSRSYTANIPGSLHKTKKEMQSNKKLMRWLSDLTNVLDRTYDRTFAKSVCPLP